jgi:preprotein translocase subunit SecB
MDATRGPGIVIDSVLLVASSFLRKESVPDKYDYNWTVETNFNLATDKKTLGMMMNVKVTTAEGFVEAAVQYFAQFSKVAGQENLTFSEYINSGSPQSMLFNYVREQIHTLTIKACVAPMILPPTVIAPSQPVVLEE